MFFDAQQTVEALWQQQPPQPAPDPVREVVAIGAAYLLGRSIRRMVQKQATDATNRCW